MSEVHVKTLSQEVWILAESDGGGIGRDRAKVAKRNGHGPVQCVAGFGISERGVVGDDHHVAFERGVVVDIEIARVCGVRNQVGGGAADRGFEVPAAFIELLDRNRVRALRSERGFEYGRGQRARDGNVRRADDVKRGVGDPVRKI